MAERVVDSIQVSFQSDVIPTEMPEMFGIHRVKVIPRIGELVYFEIRSREKMYVVTKVEHMIHSGIHSIIVRVLESEYDLSDEEA